MKTTIKTGLAAIMLLAISCTKENNTIRSPTVAQSTEKALSFTIGQRYGGGIIFYIDSTGQHGLIADTINLKRSPWWNGVYTATGATKTKIGSGYSNTHKIILSQGDSGLQYAARRCWHSKRSGYTDWYLPSRDELNELWYQRDVVGGFTDYAYWSSSEYSTYGAWKQVFPGGGQNANAKNDALDVRAIRAF